MTSPRTDGGEFFLSLGDLPLHPLAVHFAVALFPVALIWLIVVAASNKLRRRQIGRATLLVALTVPFVFIAQQSGEALGETLYEPEPHAAFGEMMMPIAMAVLVIATLFWLSVKNRWNQIVAKALGFLTVTVSIGAIAMTVVVGHSGAAATWTSVLP
jgi:uncharacterized membrane protein